MENKQILNENLMRKNTKKQMQKLYNTIKKNGGDINDKTTDSEKNVSNLKYMDNPFKQKSRKIETYEDYVSKNENKIHESNFDNDTAKIKGLANAIIPFLKLEEYPTEESVRKNLPKSFKDISDKDFDRLLSELVSKGIDFKIQESKTKEPKTKTKETNIINILKFKDFSDGDVRYISKEDSERPMYKNLPNNDKE